jgi:hypothetical protein
MSSREIGTGWSDPLQLHPGDRRLELQRLGRTDDHEHGLRGEITEPPAIRTHPTLANLRVVHCKLRVVSRIPDRRGGELVERDVSPIDVPIDLHEAEAAMVRGNVIAVQGLLDVVMTAINGDAFIDERVTEVREEWSLQRAQLDEPGQETAGRQVARTLRTLGTERSMRLRATKVTLITGIPGELRETQRTRRRTSSSSGGADSRSGAWRARTRCPERRLRRSRPPCRNRPLPIRSCLVRCGGIASERWSPS